MLVLVTDGHLPYPFGHELTGYRASNLGVLLAKAEVADVQVLWGPYVAGDRITVIVAFPGGYIAEVHAQR